MSKVLSMLECYTMDQVEKNIEFYIDQYIVEQEGEKKYKEDNAWSIKKEGHLNKNNIVFKTGLINKKKSKDKGDQHA